jgi:hypothetical protein
MASGGVMYVIIFMNIGTGDQAQLRYYHGKFERV